MMGSMMRRAMLGDGSTLSLDFTTGVLDPRLTFTRSTSGTYIGSDGYIKTMAAAPTNDPTKARFDYDPTTLAPRGLLIEASAVNLVPHSNGTIVGWGIGASRTPTNNTTDLASPDGTNNATKLVCGNAASYASYATSITGLTGGATYTISYWIRGPVGHTPRLYAVNGTVGDVTATSSTGTYSNTGWTRLTQTYVLPATTTQVYVYFLSATVVNTGDTFYVYGFQMESGTGASSLIPTTTGQGSRGYDLCYSSGASFTSWFSVGAGTMVVVSDNIKNNSQNLAAMISDGSASNYIRMGFKVGAAANEYLLTTVGTPPPYQGAADSGYAPPLNTVYRMAYAWDTNNFGIVANGGAVVTDSSGTVAGAGVLTQLVVGGDFVAVPNDIYFKNGHIRSLKYWPTRLPNAQLQALTT